MQSAYGLVGNGREWGNDPIHTVAINIHLIHPILPFAHFPPVASPAVGSQEKESLHQQLNETIQKLEAAEALADQWAYRAHRGAYPEKVSSNMAGKS